MKRNIFIVILSVLIVCPILAFSATIHVPADQSTIQAGIDAAVIEDTVLVADGTYTGNGNRDIDFLGKAIVVMSENGPEYTIIDCEGSETEPHRGFIFQNGEDSISILNGFKIQGGYGLFDHPIDGYSWAGGALCMNGSSPTFRNCIFFDNHALVRGGGIAFLNSTSRIYDCIFQANTAGLSGGWTGFGGGVYCKGGHSKISGCIFDSNHANNGGGIYIEAGTEITDCVFKNNISSDGIIYIYYSSPIFDYCLIFNNIGRGVYLTGAFAEFDNCIITNNQGRGIWCYSSSSMLSNCIITFNTHEAISGGTPTLTCCDLFGNEGGDWTGYIVDQLGIDGNFSADPLFCDTANGNFNISVSSPCHPDSSCGLVGSNDVGCMGEMVTYFGAEGETSMLNLINHSPVFIWDFWDSLSQSAFEIAVGTDYDWEYAEMWNPSVFYTSDTFVTYAGAPLNDGEAYYLRLRLSDGSDWSSWFETTFRMNTVPSAPIPIFPLQDDIVDNTPILWIENSFDAEGDIITYNFSGFHDTDCVAPNIDLQGVVEGIDSTGGQIIDPLGENCIYWWSAMAYDGYEYSDGSETQRIYIDGTPEAPTEFLAQYPPDTGGTPVCDMLTNFYWGKSYDGDPLDTVRYNLEISIDPLFNFVFNVDSIEDHQHTLTDSLQFGTHYWWKVTAFDKDGLTTESSNIPDFWTWMLGDADGNHAVNILDITYLINYLYKGGNPPHPLVMGDANGDCAVNILDITYLIAYLYKGGPEPQIGCE